MTQASRIETAQTLRHEVDEKGGFPLDSGVRRFRGSGGQKQLYYGLERGMLNEQRGGDYRSHNIIFMNCYDVSNYICTKYVQF